MSRFFTILSCYILPGFLLSANHSYGQTAIYNFVIKDENNNLVKNFPIILNGESVKTNIAGSISMPFKTTVHQVTVGLNAAANYTIVSPADGLLNLPMDANDINTITVTDKRLKANELLATQIVALQKKLQQLSAQNTAQKNQVLQQLNYLVAQGKKNNLSADQLRSAKELLNGRDSCFPLVAATLNTYVSRAKDVHDAFETMANFALDNKQAFDAMKKTVLNYNETYEQWNTQKSNYEKSINDYWQSKELALKYQNLTDYALNEVHRTYILQLNSLLKKINSYAQEKNNKKKKELKSQIIYNISNELDGLDNRNQILGEKVNILLQLLTDK